MTSLPEDKGTLVLRVLGSIATFVLLGLLYWSSQLVEREVKEVRSELANLQVKLDHFEVGPPTSAIKRDRPHINPYWPNILEEDTYYTEVLPKQIGASFKPSGQLRTAERSRPHNLHPFNNWKPVHDAMRRCVGAVAQPKFGFLETYAPDLSLKVEQRGDEYWVHLRDDIYWAPLNPSHFPSDVHLAPHFLRRHPVTAHDFKFGFNAMMNPHVQEPLAVITREDLAHVVEFRVLDDRTFVLKWKTEGGRMRYRALINTLGLSPLPCWVFQYFPDGSKIVEEDSDPDTYRFHSVFAQNFSQHWASSVIPSCGPYLFDGFTSREIAFKRNPHFHNPYCVLHEGLTIDYKTDGDAIWQAFKAGELDYVTSESFPDKVGELPIFCASRLYRKQAASGLGVERLDYLMRAYHYIGWNQKNPLFKEPQVRRALTHAIDRRGCIDQLLSHLGEELTGPLPPTDHAYDTSLTPFAYDPIEAVRLLKQSGWADLDGDGILEKEINGELLKFSFRLPYPNRSRVARSYAEAITTYLKEIGVECRPYGVEMQDLTLLFDGKEFDAIYGGWSLLHTHSPRQLWHSSGAHKPGSSNSIGFANEGVDRLIEELEYEHRPEERIALQHTFHRIIHQEIPYTYLYAPKTALLYREPVQNAFVPSQREDLVPGAIVTEPDPRQFYLKR